MLTKSKSVTQFTINLPQPTANPFGTQSAGAPFVAQEIITLTDASGAMISQTPTTAPWVVADFDADDATLTAVNARLALVGLALTKLAQA